MLKFRLIQTAADKPYTDRVYEALCGTCDVLDALGCNYFLAGGTLLGARRSGNLIPHDIDFDLDCLIEDEEKILGAVDCFATRGLKISRQMSLAPQRLFSLERTRAPLYCSCLHVDYMGCRIGDIYVYTIFDDGIARRFDIESGMYANAKMAIPSWYYSGDEYLYIRGRKFRSVRAPDVVLEKVYGADWQTPLKPGQFACNRNATSGSVSDADIEKLVLYALGQGWQGMQAGAMAWPQDIRWVGWPADVSREWVLRHEPLIYEDLVSLIESKTIIALAGGSDCGKIRALGRVIAAKAIQSERNRLLNMNGGCIHELSWQKRWFISLPIPKSWKIAISKFYALIFIKD